MDTIDTQSVDFQLRRKYRSHWRHLNPQHCLGHVNIVDVLAGQHDSMDGGTVIKRVVFVPREGMKARYRTANIIRGLEDSFSFGGCDHEHDCCGCASASCNVIPWPDYTGEEFQSGFHGEPVLNQERHFMVIQQISYNY